MFRLTFSLIIAGLVAEGETTVNDAQCADDSFPGFAETLAELRVQS